MLLDVDQAVDVLREGGIIAYPTDTVWGLGCDPWQPSAVEQLLNIKRRSKGKGFVLLSDSLDRFQPLLNNLDTKLLDRLYLGINGERPTTWLVPDALNWVSDVVKGNNKTVAIRVTRSPVSRALCYFFGKPVVSTSANISGESVLTSCQSVMEVFHNSIQGVLGGEAASSLTPSKIIDLMSNTVIRQ